jgi:hypothetical protein
MAGMLAGLDAGRSMVRLCHGWVLWTLAGCAGCIYIIIII